MSDFSDRLEGHLRDARAAPFLFVGAGLSRRYLGLDDWEGLLRRLAGIVGKPYEYYVASGDNDSPSIATEIARDLHDLWWSDARFASTRDKYKGKVKTRESALKAEAAEYTANSISNLPKRGKLFKELELLRTAVIDGAMTTNYDSLLEELFPDFAVFVGQEELLVGAPQGIGEIYKIHGTHEDPDSLVLTRADYDQFHANNPYLAAKLMTIFVEHPVILLGYSMSDPNVVTILEGIVSGLKTQERIEKLADRLIFVMWDENVDEPTMVHTVRPVGAVQVPIYAVTVRDYIEVFRVLGRLKRQFPAKLLRQLKEQVYELVLDKNSKDRLYVDIDVDQDPRDVDVVFGVGAIGQLRSYVGFKRDDLIDDVLNDGKTLDALRVVQDVLPEILTHSGNVPVYKYLRAAKLLDDDGNLTNPASVHPKVQKHVSTRPKRLGTVASHRTWVRNKVRAAPTLAKLIMNCPPHDVLFAVPGLVEDDLDPARLLDFLKKHDNLHHEASYGSQWVKMVCLYDWLVHGRQMQPATRRSNRRRKASSRKTSSKAGTSKT